MRFRTLTFVALVTLLVPIAAFRGHAQDGRGAVGTVFIDARDGARNVTVSRQGTVLAFVTLPKGTVLSAVDEHRRPAHLGGGRFEFHGDFELRALPPGDIPTLSPSGGLPAAEMMSHAPLVLGARGVDVILERAPEQR
jgi:hypothetical protein